VPEAMKIEELHFDLKSQSVATSSTLDSGLIQKIDDFILKEAKKRKVLKYDLELLRKTLE